MDDSAVCGTKCIDVVHGSSGRKKALFYTGDRYCDELVPSTSPHGSPLARLEEEEEEEENEEEVVVVGRDGEEEQSSEYSLHPLSSQLMGCTCFESGLSSAVMGICACVWCASVDV